MRRPTARSLHDGKCQPARGCCAGKLSAPTENLVPEEEQEQNPTSRSQWFQRRRPRFTYRPGGCSDNAESDGIWKCFKHAAAEVDAAARILRVVKERARMYPGKVWGSPFMGLGYWKARKVGSGWFEVSMSCLFENGRRAGEHGFSTRCDRPSAKKQ